MSQVNLSFTPLFPLFQWYLQSKEIWLNLNMKCWNLCWNTAFSAQGSRVIILVCTGTSSENICSSSGGKKGRGDETQFYHQNYFVFVKFHSQLSIWCPIDAETWPFLPPNRLTLRITLLDEEKYIGRLNSIVLFKRKP
jgi:hypothetical protein